MPMRLEKRVAYIVDQIKRPEETELLRQVYRDFSFKSPAMLREIRERRLAGKIANSHPENPREENWRFTVAQLIGRDDAEEDQPNGQRVRDAFPLADIVINASQDKTAFEELKSLLRDILRLPYAIPNAREYGMAMAFNSSLRSIDMSRQVGAAILSSAGDISPGAMKFRRRVWGSLDRGLRMDARDAALGENQNTRRKRLMLTDVVYKLAKRGFAPSRFTECSIEELERELIDAENAPSKKASYWTAWNLAECFTPRCTMHQPQRSEFRWIGTRFIVQHFLATTARVRRSGIGAVVYLQPYAKSHMPTLSRLNRN